MMSNLSEQRLRAAFLRLDSEKPRKRYLEQGKHYAYELFLYLPEQFRFDEQPYKLFWAYMAREFSITNCPSKKAIQGAIHRRSQKSLICGYIQTEPYM